MTTDACARFESLLVRAADGSLAERDEAALDAHLASCPACRRALTDQRAIRDVLLNRPPVTARPDFAFRVVAALEADESWLDRLDFRRWTWRLVPVAAALSLAAWMVVRNTGAVQTTSSSTGTFDADEPVAAALWDESVSDTSLLSLMLRAGANDRLADAYKER